MTEKGWKELISGFIAGIVSRTVTNPLERLKTIRQLSVSEFNNVSIIESFKWIYRNQGIKGFFQGNLANCLKIGPFSSIEFYSQTLFKNYFLKEKTFSGTLFCGSLSGITATVFTQPLDFAKTHLAIQTHNSSSNHTIQSILKHTQKNEGIRGLQKGCLASSQGIGPFIAIKMSINDWLRDKSASIRLNNPNLEFTINFANGAIAGTIAAILTHPTDMVRKLIQVQDLKNPKYSGFFDAFQQVWKAEGARGLFKGLMPNVLKCAPTFGVAFMVNEYLKTLLGVKQRL